MELWLWLVISSPEVIWWRSRVVEEELEKKKREFWFNVTNIISSTVRLTHSIYCEAKMALSKIIWSFRALAGIAVVQMVLASEPWTCPIHPPASVPSCSAGPMKCPSVDGASTFIGGKIEPWVGKVLRPSNINSIYALIQYIVAIQFCTRLSFLSCLFFEPTFVIASEIHFKRSSHNLFGRRSKAYARPLWMNRLGRK